MDVSPHLKNLKVFLRYNKNWHLRPYTQLMSVIQQPHFLTNDFCVCFFIFHPVLSASVESSCQTVSQQAAKMKLPETLLLRLCYRITVAVGQQPRATLTKPRRDRAVGGVHCLGLAGQQETLSRQLANLQIFFYRWESSNESKHWWADWSTC